MFITRGHFLSPYCLVYKDGKTVTNLQSVDTDLMVAIRVVGFDPEDKSAMLDLVKIDEIKFNIFSMSSMVQDLLPKDAIKVSLEE